MGRYKEVLCHEFSYFQAPSSLLRRFREPLSIEILAKNATACSKRARSLSRQGRQEGENQSGSLNFELLVRNILN